VLSSNAKTSIFFVSTLSYFQKPGLRALTSTKSPIFAHLHFHSYIVTLVVSPTTYKASSYKPSQQLGAQSGDSKCAEPSTNQRRPLPPVRPTQEPKSQYGELSLERPTRNKATTGKRGGRPLPIDADLSNQHSHSQNRQPNINRH
jgi:hypothetical protein